MLDQSIILFGSNMANSDAHNNDPLPQALIGRGGGVKGNQHLHFPQDTPHANILVTMLHSAGVPANDIEKFADSTGAILGSVAMKRAGSALGPSSPLPALLAASGVAATLVAQSPSPAAARPGVAAGSAKQARQPSPPPTRRRRRRPNRRRRQSRIARHGENVNRRNDDGSTPLQWAVYDGDVDEARRLIRAGADV